MAGGNNTVGTPGDYDWFRKTRNEEWPSKTVLFWRETRNGEVQPYQRIENIPNGLHAEKRLIQQLNEQFSENPPTNTVRLKMLINYSPCGTPGHECAERLIDFLNNHQSIEFEIYFVKEYKDYLQGNPSPMQSLQDHEQVRIQEFSDHEWEELATLTGQ